MLDDGDEFPKRNPFERTRIPFGGLIDDIKQRYPHYLSDFKVTLPLRLKGNTRVRQGNSYSTKALKGLCHEIVDNERGINIFRINNCSGLWNNGMDSRMRLMPTFASVEDPNQNPKFFLMWIRIWFRIQP